MLRFMCNTLLSMCVRLARDGWAPVAGWQPNFNMKSSKSVSPATVVTPPVVTIDSMDQGLKSGFPTAKVLSSSLDAKGAMESSTSSLQHGNESDKGAADPKINLIEGGHGNEDKEGPQDTESVGRHDIVPLCERSLLTRLDVWPFLVFYSVLIGVDLADYDNPAVESAFNVLFPLGLLSQLSLFFLQQWDVTMRSFVGYKMTDLKSMTHCLVEAPHIEKHDSSHDAEIVEVTTQSGIAVIKFQEIVFRCSTQTPDVDAWLWTATESKSVANCEERSFQRLKYPIHLPLDFYKQWRGHMGVENLVVAQRVYGPNTTPIQLPPFLELFQEQVVAPFFLFQVFCVILWSLDEYWYYALFTFFALLLFESTVAYNRLQSLQRLRSHTMSQHRPIWAMRPSFPPGRNDWTQVLVSELVPGDIVSLKELVLPKRKRQRASQDQQLNRIPADILVLSGDAVVDEALLTGESVPQLKAALGDSPGERLDLQEHKESILFGGTQLLVGNDGNSSGDFPAAPDDGVVGMVLRTGFETAQGTLLRTLAHTQKSVDGIHTQDTYVFILLLLCCAVASAALVLNEGWSDPIRNRFRLVLHVVIIVTSVVPPELPMELSLAVTNSVASLMKDCHVYCTEVFRIPLAGQVSACCFDKTGTLTSDEMLLTGVRYADGKTIDSNVLTPDASLPWPITRIMVACHSLGLNSFSSNPGAEMSNIVGDPLEKAILKTTGFTLLPRNTLRALEPMDDRPNAILILRRYRFSSKLKRMSVLAREESSEETRVFTKGAPEIIKELLDPKSIPSNYDEVSMHHMSSGKRVLALAQRVLSDKESKLHLKDLSREKVECKLQFTGFLLLDCPLKPDSKPVITELWNSGHSCFMITGDALLTAASVACDVGIIKASPSEKLPTICHITESSEQKPSAKGALHGFHVVPLNGEGKESPSRLTLSQMRELREQVETGKIALCLSGEILNKLVLHVIREESGLDSLSSAQRSVKQILFHPTAQAFLKKLVPLVSVFARHAPRQKEAVIAAFNSAGLSTLMCGDGTNDVGALRRAHVGISLISAPEVEAKQRKAAATISKERTRLKKARKDGKRVRPASGLEKSLIEMQEAQQELESVQLGDASIASPFTSRTVSIKCCKDVLQQGRCTLVTMLQIYKILGVNCLVNATVLSKLYLHGVKNGDRQLTVLGFAVTALFFFVTRGKPLRTLSAKPPPSSVLCAEALLSISLQFLVHFGVILLSAQAALSFIDPYDPSMIPDGPFNPNTLNTCTFLANAVATVNTFAVNYRGEPYVEPLKDNKLMLRSLQVCYVFLAGFALEIFPPVLFQLSEFPLLSDLENAVANSNGDTGVFQSLLNGILCTLGFPLFMLGLLIGDTVLAFGVERTVRSYFDK